MEENIIKQILELTKELAEIRGQLTALTVYMESAKYPDTDIIKRMLGIESKEEV